MVRARRAWAVGIAFMLIVQITTFGISIKPVLANGDVHSHFRFGHINWKANPDNPNEVEFTVVNAWRRTAYNSTLGCIDITTRSTVACSGADGYPDEGDVILEVIGRTKLDFGDGHILNEDLFTGVLLYRVVTIDPIENWLAGIAIDPKQPDLKIRHDYTSMGLTAQIDSCCRTFIERNNPSRNYTVSTEVSPFVRPDLGGVINNSPVSSIDPIVNCPIGTCEFIIPAVDPDGDLLEFRLSTSEESGIIAQPQGLTVSDTGKVTWNTGGIPEGLYSTSIMIEEKRRFETIGHVMIDFLIDVGGVLGHAPRFDRPPTPNDAKIFSTVAEAKPVNFDVQCSDDDAGDPVTITHQGLPEGATLTEKQRGNPSISTFNWQPIAGQSVVVIFVCSDSQDNLTFTSVSIRVSRFGLDEEEKRSLRETADDLDKVGTGVGTLKGAVFCLDDPASCKGVAQTIVVTGVLIGLGICQDMLNCPIASTIGLASNILGCYFGNLIVCASLAFELIFFAISNGFRLLAADPPDTNYKEIATLQPIQELEIVGDSAFQVAYVELINLMSEAESISKALLTSIERFQGAVQAGDLESVELQAKAIQYYSDLLSSNQLEVKAKLAILINEIAANSGQISQSIQQLQSRLATTGFTAEELQALKNLGVSDQDIENVKSVIVQASLDVNEYVLALNDYSNSIEEDLIPILEETSHEATAVIGSRTTSIRTATGTGFLNFSVKPGQLSNIASLNPSEFPSPPVNFPHGLFEFTIAGIDVGSAVTVTIIFPLNIPVGTQYWKFQNGIWFQLPSTVVSDNDGDNLLTFTLTDGGIGDADGVANGVIVDPGGVAFDEPSEIHGVKFSDLNGNSIRDAGEQGIPEWTILLDIYEDIFQRRLVDTLITETDSEGRYSFTRLDPSLDYVVLEENKLDFIQTAPFTDGTHFIQLQPSEISRGNGFGNMPFSQGEIRGTKFADLNGNGIRDSNESGLPDWDIELEIHDVFGNITTRSTTTNELGEFSFTDVPFGLHILNEVQQEGWNQTTPQIGDFSWTNRLYPFVVSAESVSIAHADMWRSLKPSHSTSSSTELSADSELSIATQTIELFEDPVGDTFGFRGGPKIDLTSVGAHYTNNSLIIQMTFDDSVGEATITRALRGFIDIDADQNPSTGALSHQTIEGAPPSAALGDEFFIEIIPDATNARVLAPLGFALTGPIAYPPITYLGNSFTIVLPECVFGGTHFNYGAVMGSFEGATDEVANNKVLKSTGEPSCHNAPRFVPVIRSGEIVDSQDFGNKSVLPGEIHGVKFEDVNANGIRDEGEQGIPNWTIFLSGPLSNATFTDDEGQYSFTGLEPGLYIVSEEIKDGYVQSGSPLHVIFLEPGEISTGNDFANMPFVLGEIHGVKFEDKNGNGVRDEGESGLAGWDIFLEEHDQFGNILPVRQTTTNELGEYSFNNVSFGLHFIVEILQEGWKQIAPEQGDFSWVNDLYPFSSLEPLSSDFQTHTREWKGVSSSVDMRQSELPLNYKDVSEVNTANVVEDPLGDTFGITEPQIDISGISANYGPDNLEITMTFNGPISPPSSGQSNSVAGFIDIDVDKNTSTGAHYPFPAGLGDNLGVEFFVDLFAESDEMVPLVAPLGFNFFTTVAHFPISFSENSFTVTIPHCFFASDFNYGAEIGTFLEITDIVPNENALTSTGTPSCPNRMLFVPILRSSEVSEGNDFANKMELFCGRPVEAYASVIDGTENDDTLIGTSGINLIRGFGGNDRIEGRGAGDCLIGGDGNDTIFGNSGRDMIEGEDGDDILSGGGGQDVIDGGKGNDSIKGNAGNDIMDGGDDSDTCKGGTGSNTKKNCEA